jgi:hypothetical protein
MPKFTEVKLSDYDRRDLKACNWDLRHTTFRLIPMDNGFMLRDTCTFNPWPMRERFATKDEAVILAWRAHDFKTGRRMNADLLGA